MTNDAADDMPEGEDDDLDPVVGAILKTLWDHGQSGADKDLSLARLSKRASVQMSVLRRVLTQLGAADLVDTVIEEDGRGTARLTDEGQAVCGQLFGEPDGGDAAPPVLH
ncbi:hypothetical protein SAMN04488595_103332 [Ralstonia sp. 25mfcol4.1]|uniref:ArsR family transcriptional regulator n=1 Tax=Ralstonia sp. 25mfcol4.1 TaxID=1761899 RepID=UPI00087E4621|nr:ArsR family transcriptional regulator [Ralstonia sp. 25mfcol4.1]SDO97623.1 hypothetical protein SAMN04488595_103332 [Ralstonia sp. 25mfcol4.1]